MEYQSHALNLPCRSRICSLHAVLNNLSQSKKKSAFEIGDQRHVICPIELTVQCVYVHPISSYGTLHIAAFSGREFRDIHSIPLSSNSPLASLSLSSSNHPE